MKFLIYSKQFQFHDNNLKVEWEHFILYLKKTISYHDQKIVKFGTSSGKIMKFSLYSKEVQFQTSDCDPQIGDI